VADGVVVDPALDLAQRLAPGDLRGQLGAELRLVAGPASSARSGASRSPLPARTPAPSSVAVSTT